jgi:exonuclease III
MDNDSQNNDLVIIQNAQNQQNIEEEAPKKKTLNMNLINNVNNNLSLLSYTMYSNGSYINERMIKICNLIKRYKPDIIALHSLKIDKYQELYSRIINEYESTQVYKTENLEYSSVIFTKRDKIYIEKKSGNPYYFDLENSYDNNKIIGLEITFNDKKIHIITTHFDDKEENDNIRLEQFNILHNMLKVENIKRAIILGNFEIMNTYEVLESHIMINANELKDIWIEAGCPSYVRNTYEDMRHERIYIYNIKKYNIISLALFGVQNISETIKVTPSNNYGLFAKINLN